MRRPSRRRAAAARPADDDELVLVGLTGIAAPLPKPSISKPAPGHEVFVFPCLLRERPIERHIKCGPPTSHTSGSPGSTGRDHPVNASGRYPPASVRANSRDPGPASGSRIRHAAQDFP
jgi:hypothetical protein